MFLQKGSYLVAAACVFIVTGALGVVANTIQLVFICRDRARKKSAFCLTLLSLNIADLLASLVFLSQGLLMIMRHSLLIDFLLFNYIFKTFYSAGIFSVTSSYCHVVFIALQRVIAVALPLQVKHIFTKSRCFVILALMWIISLILPIIVYFYIGAAFLMAVMSMITSLILTILYSVICYKTMKRGIVDNIGENMQRRREQSDKHVLMYSVAISIAFVVSNLPTSVNSFIPYPFVLSVISNILIILNPFLDTLLYFLWNYYKHKKQRLGNRALPVLNLQQINSELPDEWTTRL